MATPLSVAEVASTVTALQATVSAQQVDLAVLTIRIDELETSVATLLEGLPEETALDSFQQDQINDLESRVSGLELIASSTPNAWQNVSPLVSPTASPTS
jgi:hypothetical protein